MLDAPGMIQWITAITGVIFGTVAIGRGIIKDRADKRQQDERSVIDERAVFRDEFDSVVKGLNDYVTHLENRIRDQDLQQTKIRDNLAVCEADKVRQDRLISTQARQIADLVDQLEDAKAEIRALGIRLGDMGK